MIFSPLAQTYLTPDNMLSIPARQSAFAQNPNSPTYLPDRAGLFGNISPMRRRPASPILTPSSPAVRMGENAAPPDGPPSQPGNAPNITDLAPNVRKSFDYEGAYNAIVPPEKKPSTLEALGRIIGPALMAYNNPAAAQSMMMQTQRRDDRNREFRQEVLRDLIMKRVTDAQASDEAYYRDTAPFSSGRDRLRWDPETNQTAMLHKGEQDFEAYANALDLEPGSDEYFNAVEDYVLRANGPAAFERNKQIDDYRTGNDLRIEGVRQNNRQDLEGIRQDNRVNLKQTPTYRDTHGAPPRQSGGGREAIPTISSLEEARSLPKGTKFRTPDGRIKVR